jgi:molybdate transport system substrate-binding protein
MNRVWIVAIAAGLMLARSASAQESNANEILVFAASSMKPVLDQIGPKFSGGKLTISYGSSSALAQQIQNGAPADIFITADPAWAGKLEETAKVVKREDFLGNSLVLIAGSKAAEFVTRPEDLLHDAVKHIAIGEPGSVPAGKYAKEALTALGLWDRLSAKFVPAADVRQALLYVERGEAEAGIVYATDAKSVTDVKLIAALDANLKAPVRYSIVLIDRKVRSTAADAAFAYLLSEDSMNAYMAAGFSRPAAAKPAKTKD